MAGTQQIHPKTSLLDVPTEMISAVCSNLHKEDLKSVRLSCHGLSEITIPILYDKVVITSLDDNAGLFECVVDVPGLARHVKTLVLDIPRFRDVSAAYYMKYLMKQVEHDMARHSPPFALKQPPAALLEKLEKVKWFRDPVRTSHRMKVMDLFGLPYSYDLYTAIRNKQTRCIDTSLPRCMTIAFNKCVNIQQLEVQTEWLPYDQPLNSTLESLLPRFASSGRVARQFNPLLLRPVPLVQDNGSRKHILFHLLEAVNRVNHLKLGKGFIMLADQLTSIKLLCFQHLTSLTLWIPTKLPTDVPILVSRLTPVLRATLNLKHLHVAASNMTRFEYADHYRHPLFPLLQGCVWPRLSSLELEGMVASTRDLLTLLKRHKHVKYLSLISMDIRSDYPHTIGYETSTAQISEDLVHLFWNMRRLMSLKVLSLGPSFRIQAGETRWRPIAEDFAAFKKKWEAFVLDHGPLDSMPGMYDFKEES
ncbi:MAG: hypothetical protein Q9169_005089 [Polycauliona sp. 2 TL-2023]